MSDGDAERRAEVIARLEKLQYELDVESITLYERIDADGKPTIVVNSWPIPDVLAFDGCRELWQASVPFVRDGVFDEAEADGGLSRWLVAQSQQFVLPAYSYYRLANPVKVWLQGVQFGVRPASDVLSGLLVPGDPRTATKLELAAVASKAKVLVGVFRENRENFERLEKSVADLRSMCRRDAGTEFERFLNDDLRTLRWKRWNWLEWCVFADIVAHYAAALLPEVFAECRQVSQSVWNRPQEINWPSLEKELDLLAAKLEWLEPKAMSSSATPSLQNLNLTNVTAKPTRKGRKIKFVDPDEAAILREYKYVRNIAATIEALKLQPISGVSALKRVSRIVNRDRTRQSRKRKHA